MRRFEREPQSLLGFAQRGLCGFALADVEQNSVENRSIRSFRTDDHALIPEPDDAPVLCNHAVFRKKRTARLVQPLLFGQDQFAILRMDMLEPQRGVREPFFGGISEIFLDLRADVVPTRIRPELGNVNDARYSLDERAVQGLIGGEDGREGVVSGRLGDRGTHSVERGSRGLSPHEIDKRHSSQPSRSKRTHLALNQAG